MQSFAMFVVFFLSAVSLCHCISVPLDQSVCLRAVHRVQSFSMFVVFFLSAVFHEVGCQPSQEHNS